VDPHVRQRRAVSTSSRQSASSEPAGKIGADEDAVAALFDGALGASGGGGAGAHTGINDPRRRRVKDADADRPRLLTARREALALYREVLRVSNLFVWRDERGGEWAQRIRSSARGEFEAARGESDPEMAARMIVTARDALHRAVDRFRDRRAAVIEDEARRADAGVAAPVPLGGAGDGGGGGGGQQQLAPSWAEGVPLVRGGPGGGGRGGGG